MLELLAPKFGVARSVGVPGPLIGLAGLALEAVAVVNVLADSRVVRVRAASSDTTTALLFNHLSFHSTPACFGP